KRKAPRRPSCRVWSRRWRSTTRAAIDREPSSSRSAPLGTNPEAVCTSPNSSKERSASWVVREEHDGEVNGSVIRSALRGGYGAELTWRNDARAGNRRHRSEEARVGERQVDRWET